MQLKIKTIILQEMVSQSIKGASHNKMIPITSLMAIELKDQTLTLITTDANNTLKIIEKDIEGGDFYIVVQAEIFSKLISKITTETITLSLKENNLEVKGNGVYNIELPLDEEGKLIKFPEYNFNTKAKKQKFDSSNIDILLNANKAALADTMELPFLTGYYIDKGVITTDSFKVCHSDVKIFDDKLLLTAEMVELLDLMEGKKIDLQQDKNKLLFTTDNIVIYGVQLDGIEDYPIDSIKEYLKTAFDSNCKLSRSDLLNVLDRLNLFVTTYDRNAVYLTFTPKGVIFDSRKSN
ncbi:MAG: hypothetical protein GX879_04915, partial [Bacteroidales bacterium]|nr:hypothetical protein [Bacteroidales bacterium]